MRSAIILFGILIAVLQVAAQPTGYKNYWEEAPKKVPGKGSVDAPLMGNGDLTMSLGQQGNEICYYLSKNDFWRLRSKADGLSGPRVAGIFHIRLEGENKPVFRAEQTLSNGITTVRFEEGKGVLEAKSWVSATENLVFVELRAIGAPLNVSFTLSAPENPMAKYEKGVSGSISYQTRAFVDSVDIATEVAIALKPLQSGQGGRIEPGKPLVLVLAVESNFKHKKPLSQVLSLAKAMGVKKYNSLLKKHEDWWADYWSKSTVNMKDSVLMKAYYQGLYTMASCSRDPKFPPAIFGWVTDDDPMWNGDYHLNYNFQAPFYALHAANRLDQALPHDAPLLDFISRGEWYARQVTGIRGILYPVGIGPLGIEVTRDFPIYEIEKGGLFFGQRSNTAYGLLNMAQYWRTTYDTDYAKKIYPYALAVINFWEDYLKYENERYVVYGDAIHEGSGKDMNPILSLGLIRNSFDLMLDLSDILGRDQLRRKKWQHILDHISVYPVQMRDGKKVFRYTEKGTAWWNDNGLGIQHIYPANGVTLDSSSALLEVSRNTISAMQRWHDSNTSNSFFMAAVRVGYDGEIVLNQLRKYALNTYPNGFMKNNPHGIENSGTVANVLNEMLCMSVGNVIRLFSLPRHQDASFENIRTWGAFLISAARENGEIVSVRLKSEKGKVCTIVNPWANSDVQLIRDGKKAEVLSGNKLSFQTETNEVIELSNTKK